MVRSFKIVVRFQDGDDVDFWFNDCNEAYSYFEYLVKFELDGLIKHVWNISLLYGKKVLRHYSNYLNVKH